MRIVETFADPFCVSVNDLPAEYQLELTELQELDEMLATYSESGYCLFDFYKTLPDTFVDLKDDALLHTSMFASSYCCCEQASSQMKLNKSRTRTQLTDDHLEAVMRLSAISIKLDISKLVADMQRYPSHYL